MHELFLTSHIANDDLSRTVRILQGYCGMKPVSLLERRLMWEGPRARTNLKGIDPNFVTRQPPQLAPVWRGLHEQLVRQSYILTLIYDVTRDFSQAEASGSEEKPILDCDQLPGTLRWSDLPDPGVNRPVNTRPIINIDDQRGLCTIMQSMGHRFTREIIQECYRFINNNVIFELSRYLQLPDDAGNKQQPKISTHLPPFQSLIAFDSENKWILTASVRVANGNDPDQMQQGIGELTTVKTEFEGCFDLHMVDRHTVDTRVKI
ncbi:Mediator of RNA polymerase II transcription subunit 18 [Lachnellula arida]|uniref:Mediator of RNA polymerase II transcription subunit 18 n=1 Tax=Lachnellula arida TaxID=1316785 RepID=A0A8T9B426_9HELO|nr:Mediator of RNA polymerase II transcription subunit 18 [Lachnellula arida]